jgi:hypothetical protein
VQGSSDPPGTHQREIIHAEFLSHFKSMSTSTSISSTSSSTSSSADTTTTSGSRGAELYTVIRAASSDFQAYIDSSHEAVQLLHQAFVYCIFVSQI